MEFNITTKELSIDGKIIKKLGCPYHKKWEELRVLSGPAARMCNQCERKVIDTAYVTGAELLEMVKDDPETCVKVDIRQPNITVVK